MLEISRQTALPHGILSKTPWYVGIDSCHSCMKSSRDLRLSRERLSKHATSGVPHIKNPSELDPATEEAMQSALHAQSTFLDMSRSTIAGHLLRHAETTTSDRTSWSIG
jgi:hypothetical protein